MMTGRQHALPLPQPVGHLLRRLERHGQVPVSDGFAVVHRGPDNLEPRQSTLPGRLLKLLGAEHNHIKGHRVLRRLRLRHAPLPQVSVELGDAKLGADREAHVLCYPTTILARVIVQPGSGSTRDIALCYLAGGKQAAPALGPDVCIVQETAGSYDKVGDGGVFDYTDTVSWAKEQAGGFEVGKLWLIGFSAGCQGVRTQILQGCNADYVLAIDGIHLPISGTPQEYKTAPWLATKARADAGQCVFFCSYSATEAYNFKTVRASLQQLFGIDPGCFGPPTEPCVQGSGNFLVFGSTQAGSGTPATEHTSQVNELLPNLIPVALGKSTLGGGGGRRGLLYVGAAVLVLGAYWLWG